MMPDRQNVNFTATIQVHDGDVGVLRVTGEVDMATADQVLECFRQAAQRQITEVVVDGSDVTFMDSTGIHALIEGKKLIHQAGSQVVLVPSPPLRKVLDIAVPDTFDAYDSVDEAVDAVRTGGGRDS